MFFKLTSLLIFVIGFISCEIIDYKKAAEILNRFSEENKLGTPHLSFVYFMRDYDKKYASTGELFNRFHNFNINVQKAEELQQKQNGIANFGITIFSDLSEQELSQLTGLKVQLNNSTNENDGKEAEEKKRIQEVIDIVNHRKDVPTEFDWRNKGYVTKVKNQFRCGGCWAFSAVATIETVHAIKTNQLVDLSPQQLIDCDLEDNGCSGGLMDIAFQYIINADGVETEEDYPYKGRQSNVCSATPDDGRFRVQLESYTKIITGEEDMKRWIHTAGPLSIGLNADPLTFYQNGVVDFDETQCDPRALNHGVIIVGYGEEKGQSGGETLPYWIVKNSWGDKWGEQGYLRIRRGKNTCGIAEYVVGAITK